MSENSLCNSEPLPKLSSCSGLSSWSGMIWERRRLAFNSQKSPCENQSKESFFFLRFAWGRSISLRTVIYEISSLTTFQEQVWFLIERNSPSDSSYFCNSKIWGFVFDVLASQILWPSTTGWNSLEGTSPQLLRSLGRYGWFLFHWKRQKEIFQWVMKLLIPLSLSLLILFPRRRESILNVMLTERRLQIMKRKCLLYSTRTWDRAA